MDHRDLFAVANLLVAFCFCN